MSHAPFAVRSRAEGTHQLPFPDFDAVCRNAAHDWSAYCQLYRHVHTSAQADRFMLEYMKDHLRLTKDSFSSGAVDERRASVVDHLRDAALYYRKREKLVCHPAGASPPSDSHYSALFHASFDVANAFKDESAQLLLKTAYQPGYEALTSFDQADAYRKMQAWLVMYIDMLALQGYRAQTEIGILRAMRLLLFTLTVASSQLSGLIQHAVDEAGMAPLGAPPEIDKMPMNELLPAVLAWRNRFFLGVLIGPTLPPEPEHEW